MLGCQANRIGSARGLYRSFPDFEDPNAAHPTLAGRMRIYAAAQLSTARFSFASAWSHCWAIASNDRRASSNCAGSNSHSRSRPTFTSRTSPSAASTPRCLVIACRVMSVPDVSWVMDIAPPAHSTAMSRSLISSPSAANSGAQLRSGLFAGAALRFGDMLFDIHQLFIPSRSVQAKCCCTPRRRNFIETGFHDAEFHAPLDVLELEDDQGRGLLRIVDGRIDGARMPAPGQQSLRNDAFYEHLHHEVLVAGIRYLPFHGPACGEGFAFEIDAEPSAKFFRVRQCAPDSRSRRLQQNLSFNAVRRCVHMQPPGCILDDAP